MNARAPSRCPPSNQTEADGLRRKGRVFTLRLEGKAEVELRKLYKAYELIRWELPWPRANSFGAFVVWAARQWKPAKKAPVGRMLRPKAGR
jgi:hypothetical protein